MGSIKKAIVLLVAISILTAFAPSIWAQDTDKININTATVEQITQLKGIGQSYAERVIKYRDENGTFKTPDDIMKVPGIGQKTFAQNKDRITVE